ncbi:hypothetical protein MMON44395_07940 [Mycolicibacterium monacense DSM 44395]|nr:hypothetical protein [Mycolicibacterium monacense DSM 44395]
MAEQKHRPPLGEFPSNRTQGAMTKVTSPAPRSREHGH